MKSSSENIRVEKIKNNETHEITMTSDPFHQFFVKANFDPYPGEWVLFTKDAIVTHGKDIRALYNEIEKQGYQKIEVCAFWVPPRDVILAPSVFLL